MKQFIAFALVLGLFASVTDCEAARKKSKNSKNKATHSKKADVKKKTKSKTQKVKTATEDEE